MTAVQAFGYRLPRFAVQLPCAFFTEQGVAEGQSLDLSEQGLRVLFTHPVLSGTGGRLRLQLESCWFEVEAEVVHSEVCAAGLRFVFASEAERRFLHAVIRLAARQQGASHAPVKAYAGL